MEFLNSIDLGSGILLVACCAGLCLVGVVLAVAFQFLGGIFQLFFGLLEVFLNILSGGPVAWCGCLIVLIVCGVCGFLSVGVVSTLSSCGTVNATNFCRLFGF